MTTNDPDDIFQAERRRIMREQQCGSTFSQFAF